MKKNPDSGKYQYECQKDIKESEPVATDLLSISWSGLFNQGGGANVSSTSFPIDHFDADFSSKAITTSYIYTQLNRY